MLSISCLGKLFNMTFFSYLSILLLLKVLLVHCIFPVCILKYLLDSETIVATHVVPLAVWVLNYVVPFQGFQRSINLFIPWLNPHAKYHRPCNHFFILHLRRVVSFFFFNKGFRNSVTLNGNSS